MINHTYVGPKISQNIFNQILYSFLHAIIHKTQKCLGKYKYLNISNE